MTGARIYTALRLERAALRAGLREEFRAGHLGPVAGPAVVRVGMGARRAPTSLLAGAASPEHDRDTTGPVAGPGLGVGPVAGLMAGLAGGLAPHVRPGEIVVASTVLRSDALSGDMLGRGVLGREALRSGALRRRVLGREVLGGDGLGGGVPVAVLSAPLLAGALRRLGLTVHIGPIVSVPRVAHGDARGRLAGTGALAVDMESGWLATVSAAAGEPFAVARVVVDTVGHPLWGVGTVVRGVRGLRTLRRMVPALVRWVAAVGPRQVCLLHPGWPGVAARECDVVLVVGAGPASQSRRLVDVVGRTGVPARLVHDAAQVDLAWLAGAGRVGVLAEESGPVVDDLVLGLRGLGRVTLVRSKRGVVEEVG